jgi:hypothetical protein
MRYCLACRSFSAEGPLCTQCGRSFGGRLCNSKKRHLNPSDSQFCGQCGTADLAEAASYVPLGCSGRAVVWGLIVTFIWWSGAHLAQWGSQVIEATHHRSPIAWFTETGVDIFALVLAFYLFSFLLPHEVGRQFRSLTVCFCSGVLRCGFGIMRWGVKTVGRLLSHSD